MGLKLIFAYCEHLLTETYVPIIFTANSSGEITFSLGTIFQEAVIPNREAIHPLNPPQNHRFKSPVAADGEVQQEVRHKHIKFTNFLKPESF